MQVFFLHLLEELGLARHIALVGLLEDGRQTLRGEPLGGV